MKIEKTHGARIPELRIGTVKITGTECTQAVENALLIGHRTLIQPRSIGMKTPKATHSFQQCHPGVALPHHEDVPHCYLPPEGTIAWKACSEQLIARLLIRQIGQ